MMEPDRAVTLMIDSGVGGLSVLALAKRMLPEENFYFFADAANAPYGDKQPQEIVDILHALLKNCSRYPVKAILLACNTATSAAAAKLRSELSIPVIGMEPALKPAVLNTNGQVIVMATQLTIREEKFRNLLARYGEGRDIVPLPCPGLMEIVEKDPAGQSAEEYLKKVLEPYKDTADSVVLGCTHYVFLRPLIRRLFPQLRIFDGNEGVVRHLDTVLAENNFSGGESFIKVDCSLSDERRKNEYLKKCSAMLSYCDTIYNQQISNS